MTRQTPPPPPWGRPVSDPRYALAGLLTCSECGQRLSPMQTVNGRAYGSPCGCRLIMVDAQLVERLVLDAVEANEPPGAVGLAGVDRIDVFRQVVAEVRIGGSADDLEIVFVT